MKYATLTLIRPVIAFVLGAIGVLAFSPFDIWIIALISLTGLLYLITDRSPKQAAMIGFCWGVGLFLFGVSWVYVSIQHFGGVAVPVAVALCLLLALYLALYPMLFSALLIKINPVTSYKQLLLLVPLLWFAIEWLRGWLFTGFPWLQFGYTQLDGPLKPIAPIGGVDTITMLLLLISALMVITLKTKKIVPGIIAVLLLLCPLLFPIDWTKPKPQSELKVALVQGNTEQSIKWSPDYLQQIISTYVSLTLPLFEENDIVIWPEAAVPDIERRHQPLLQELDQVAREKNSTLILGIINHQIKTKNTYNTAIILGDKEYPYYYNEKNRYNKYYLVPFGEMIPFQFLFGIISAILDFPMSTLTPGDYIQPPLIAQNTRFLMAICYEVIKGKQLRDNFTTNTDFLVTISNDAWFGKSIGPWQHFQMAKMRALELGRPLLRSTNNGITAVIDHLGHSIKQIPQFEEAVLQTTLSAREGMTPFVRFGYLFPWLWSFINAALYLSLFIYTKYRH